MSDTIKTMLIADYANRVLLRRLFSAEYHIEEALNGPEALEKLRTLDEVTVMMLDIDIPQMDGFALLAEMQRDPKLRDIPTVVITSGEDQETQIKALSGGATDVLTKPFSPQIFYHRVSNAIASKTAIKLAEQNRGYEMELRISSRDEKTGLFNKQAFIRRAERLLRDNPHKKYVLARWDIDNFKVYNDYFGTAAGDEFLRRVGDYYITHSNKMPGLALYARFDADHFVLLREVDSFDPQKITELIKRMVSINNTLTFEFSPRMGLYRIDDPTVDVTLMCDRALLALRSIKNQYGLRYAWYDDSMRQAIIDEQAIVNKMEQALAEGQFIVYLQPQYNYDISSLIGAEALVRWNHPDNGLLMPGSFLPVFERNGFIFKLDRYVWEQVCKSMRRWLDKGLKVPPISVNVSRRDLYSADLIDFFSGLISEYGLKPSMLHLEITESAYMENPEQLIHTVAKLQDAGFHIEMDDFGSGFSSLNTLKDVPVDLLKLDMKFVSENPGNTRDGSILSSVVRMAHAIRLPVIAEGVETKQQADYLKSIDCFYMQGYFFSRPLSLESFEKLISQSGTGPEQNIFFTGGMDGAADILNASTHSTLLFNSFPGGAGVIEFDDGRLLALRLNDRFFETVGTTREAYQRWQYNMMDRLTPKFKETVTDTILAAINTGEEKGCELCAYPFTEGGDYIWTFCRFRCLAGKAGAYILSFSIENISEQKRLISEQLETQRLLRESQEKLAEARLELETLIGSIPGRTHAQQRISTIVTNIPGGLAIYKSENGRLTRVYISDRAYTVLGYRPGESRLWEPDRCFGRLHPVDAAYIKRKFSAVDVHDLDEASGYEFQYDLRVIPEDGSQRWVHLVSRRVFDHGELYFYCNFTDVTKRHGALEELRIREEEYRIGVEQSGKIIFRYSIADRHIDAPDKMVTQFGLPRVISDGPQAFLRTGLLHTDSIDAWMSFFTAMDAGEPEGVSEFQIKRSDGKYRWFRGQFTVIKDSQGKPVTAIISYEDITEEREKGKSRAFEYMAFFRAIRTVYPLTIAANLTQNSYYMMEYEHYYAKRAAERGVYDQLIQDGLYTVPDEDKQAFFNAYGRDNILARFAAGEDLVRLEHRQIGDDGVCRWMETIALRVDNPYDDDVLQITVSRCIDQQKATEAKLKEALDISTGRLAERLRFGSIISRVAPGLITVRYADAGPNEPPFTVGSLLQSLGYDQQEQLEMAAGIGVLVLPEDKDYVSKYVRMVGEEHPETYELEFRVWRKDGQPAWLSARGSRFVDENGKLGYVTTFMDITERRQLVDELRASQESYRTVIENSDQLIYTYNIIDSTAYLPERMRKLLGLPRIVEKVPESVLDRGVILDDSLEDYAAFYSSIRAGKPCERDWLLHRKTSRGAALWLKARYILTESTDGTPVTATIYMDDVTVNKRTVEELIDRAQRDGMTGLYNRAAAELYVKEELDKGGNTCVMLILDLDDLKTINDTLGHEQGDRAIKAIGQVMQDHFRRSDIVGRLGGDEFIAFLPDTRGGATLSRSLSSLLKKLSFIAIGKDNGQFAHCSIGVAEGHPGEDDFASLYRKADTALYYVKRNGKNDYAFYEPDMEKGNYHYMSHTILSIQDEATLDRSELRRLVGAIAAYYPLVISVNLSRNHYFMMESRECVKFGLPASGRYDDFLEAICDLFLPKCRQEMMRLMSRDALFGAYERGESSVRVCCKRLNYEWSESISVFYTNDNGDVCVFIFSRPAP